MTGSSSTCCSRAQIGQWMSGDFPERRSVAPRRDKSRRRSQQAVAPFLPIASNRSGEPIWKPRQCVGQPVFVTGTAGNDGTIAATAVRQGLGGRFGRGGPPDGGVRPDRRSMIDA